MFRIMIQKKTHDRWLDTIVYSEFDTIFDAVWVQLKERLESSEDMDSRFKVKKKPKTQFEMSEIRRNYWGAYKAILEDLKNKTVSIT